MNALLKYRHEMTERYLQTLGAMWFWDQPYYRLPYPFNAQRGSYENLPDEYLEDRDWIIWARLMVPPAEQTRHAKR